MPSDVSNECETCLNQRAYLLKRFYAFQSSLELNDNDWWSTLLRSDTGKKLQSYGMQAFMEKLGIPKVSLTKIVAYFCNLPRYEPSFQPFKGVANFEESRKESLQWVLMVLIPFTAAQMCLDSSLQSSRLAELCVWLWQVVFPFVLMHGGLSLEDTEVVNDQAFHTLCDSVTETLCGNIVVLTQQWPLSLAAFEALQLLLESSNRKHTFFRLLSDQMYANMLHSGVSTRRIIDVYISCIKTMHLLDSSFVGFNDAMAPTRAYLRQRPDSIKVIVSLLLSGQVLRSEQGWPQCPTFSKVQLHDPNSMHVEQPEDGSYGIDYDWEPPLRKEQSIWPQQPLNVDKRSSLKAQAQLTARFGPVKGSDIVSQLVQIYTSKDVFINAFQELLSSKLLKLQRKTDIDAQRQQIESLKHIFGASALHMCEVMLQDVACSYAFDAEIHVELQRLGVANGLHAAILSRQFWPAFEVLDSPFVRLPGLLNSWLRVYQDRFYKLKPNRTLCWLPHLGTVTLDVQLDSGESVCGIMCSPLQATVLSALAECPSNAASTEELRHRCFITAKSLRSALQFWVRLSLVKEVKRGQFAAIRGLDELGAKARDNLLIRRCDHAEFENAARADELFDFAADDAAVISDGEDSTGRLNVDSESSSRGTIKPDGPGKDGRELNANEQRMLTMVVTNIVKNLGPISATEICKRTSLMLPMFGNLNVGHIRTLAESLLEKGVIKSGSKDFFEPVKKSSFSS